MSAPITAATLGLVGDAVKQAEYLKLFRADNIVRDCEAIRENITSEYPPEKKKWSVLGQSFGGFCAVTYLSKLWVSQKVYDPLSLLFLPGLLWRLILACEARRACGRFSQLEAFPHLGTDQIPFLSGRTVSF